MCQGGKPGTGKLCTDPPTPVGAWSMALGYGSTLSTSVFMKSAKSRETAYSAVVVTVPDYIIFSCFYDPLLGQKRYRDGDTFTTTAVSCCTTFC